MVHRDTVRAKAWESAICPERFNPVEALIDVVTRAETPEDGRRVLRIFMREHVTHLTRRLRDTARKLREERE